jgi:L-2,4-diaminobutyrate transaminase
LERENITENAATVGKYFQECMHETFATNPIVGEVRGVGMLTAIECVADKSKKRRFPSSLKIGAQLSAAALKHGLIARAMPQGDILGFAPPLVATKEDIDQIVEATALAVRDVGDALSRTRFADSA